MWRISWRNITQNKKRFLFSLLGMIVGISFITSMLIADETTNDVFDYYEKMYVANADYWVLSDEHTFTEGDVASVSNSPYVTDTLFALDKQAFFELEGDQSLHQRSVRITGVSDEASSLLSLPVIEGSLDNEGIVLTENVAELLQKEVGDTVKFSNMGEATISAIVEYTQILASPSDWKGAEVANFRVIAPLHLLRDWLGENDAVSYVRFQTNEGGNELFTALQEEFMNDHLYVQPVVADDLQNNDISGLYTFFYLIASLSILISGFIVFNMIYTSVVERKREFAVMKSFGYLQRSISKLIFIEVLLLAILSVVIGIPIGTWLGDLFMKTLLSIFEFDMVYTLHWKLPVIIASVIGIVFPIVFSLFPIYEAGKTSVLLTLKTVNQTDASKKQNIFRAVLGVGLLVFIFIDHPVSYVAMIVSVILLFPFLLKGINRLLAPLYRMIFGFTGMLATQNLSQQMNRNANTSAILAIGVSVILLLSAAIESAPETYDRDIRSTYGGDVRITAEVPWSAEDQSVFESYDSVIQVDPLTEATPITWETMEQEEKQFSMLSVRKDGPALFEEKLGKNLYDALKKEPSVLLGSRAFLEWGGDVGGFIRINTPAGTTEFKVIDVVETSHYSGYVAFMDEQYTSDIFGWQNSFDLLLTVASDANRDHLREQLWTDFEHHLTNVETVEDEIRSTTAALAGANDLILMMLVLMIGLASIGTANTLLMNTFERTTEIGTMRALGLTKQQVRTMIVGEGILIGFTGVFGGIVTGVILLYMMSTSEILGGFIIFNLPLGNVFVALFSGVLLSIIAAWIASRSASQLNISSTLKES